MSLYLKYRPSDFTNLVWQSFVKETLQKAIENNKTVWAYLFCWPRWTWKTSSARIFAKAINCENPIKWNPCLKCNICRDFADEKLIDIIEIDAASHTWVDNIREIIEKAQFSPTKTKYKIYIIDEVHMLSKWAFNALLKILEEPPKHVKFILATTETHKVPETIISRCQRYDFKRISDIDIKNRLLFIADSENIKVDEKSLKYIIKNSSWWLRNAISLFEQLVFENEINYEEIVEKLEIVDENEIDLFLDKLINWDNSVINIIEKNIDNWKNIKLFFKELLFYTKNKSLEILKKWWNITSYIRVLEILDESYSKTKNSLDENITFIIWILKIIDSDDNNNIIKNNIIPPLEKKSHIKKENINKIDVDNNIEQNTEISQEDIWDIFGDNSEINNKKEVEIFANNSGFNCNNFIDKLKENGAKWWLTMNIRWANISLNIDTLNIKTKTNFAKKSIDNNDNITLIIKTLNDIWITNPKINIT